MSISYSGGVFREPQPHQSYGAEAVERIVESAIDSFFATLARETGAAAGDLAPDAFVAFEQAAKAVTAEWMRSNL